MRDYRSQYIAARSAQGSQSTEAGAAGAPRLSRKQRRFNDCLNRRVNRRLKSLNDAGLPVSLSIGPDGRPRVKVDLRAARKAAEAKAAAGEVVIDSLPPFPCEGTEELKVLFDDAAKMKVDV